MAPENFNYPTRFKKSVQVVLEQYLYDTRSYLKEKLLNCSMYKTKSLQQMTTSFSLWLEGSRDLCIGDIEWLCATYPTDTLMLRHVLDPSEQGYYGQVGVPGPTSKAEGMLKIALEIHDYLTSKVLQLNQQSSIDEYELDSIMDQINGYVLKLETNFPT